MFRENLNKILKKIPFYLILGIGGCSLFSSTKSSSFSLRTKKDKVFLVRRGSSLKGVGQSKKYAALFGRNLIKVPQEKFTARVRYFLYLLRVIKGYYVDRNLLRNTLLIEKVIDHAKKDLLNLSFKKIKEKKYSLVIGKVRVNFSKFLSDTDLSVLLAFLSYYSDKKSNRLNQRKNLKKGRKYIAGSLVKLLDNYSEILSKEEYKDLKDGTKGIFGGLGVVVTLADNHVLTVVKPIPNSPAYKAGVKKGDMIIAINGKSTFSLSFNKIIKIMKDKPGTTVRLKILSKGGLNSHDLILKREIIFVDSVERKIIKYSNKSYLYLLVETFASRTSSEIKKYIEEAKRDFPDLAGVVLDLRQNPGGLLSQAIKVSDLFLDEGLIVKIKGKLKDVKYAQRNKVWEGPLALLIDGNTASASEIVTAALQDNNKAIIIGQASYGKATVQTLFELPSKEALKITIARYYPPSGLSLEHSGVMPDLMVHPLYFRKNNLNLLGVERYDDSKLLPYNLFNKKFKDKRKLSLYNLYHLSRNKEQAQEFVLDLSLFTLDKVRTNWHHEKNKKSLFFKNKLVHQRLMHLNKKISHRLKKLYNVSWENNFYYKNSRELSLEVGHKIDDEKSFEQGKEMTLEYSIKNFDDIPVERASLFVKEATSGLFLKEKLVGHIKKAEAQEGVLKFFVPNLLGKKEELLNLRIGLAVDGIPILSSVTPYTVRVKSFKPAQLKTFVTLKEGEGDIEGKIEPRESAFIHLKLVNKGRYDADKVSLKFVNLSGRQISLGDFPSEVGKLRAGETKEVHILIKGSKHLFDSQLPFGVYVYSKSLEEPIRRQITILSVPNLSRVDGKPKLTFH